MIDPSRVGPVCFSGYDPEVFFRDESLRNSCSQAIELGSPMTRLANQVLGEKLPYGTLLVNLLGSLPLSLLMGLAFHTTLIPRAWRIA